jgi:hypothetical protein
MAKKKKNKTKVTKKMIRRAREAEQLSITPRDYLGYPHTAQAMKEA